MNDKQSFDSWMENYGIYQGFCMMAAFLLALICKLTTGSWFPFHK